MDGLARSRTREMHRLQCSDLRQWLCQHCSRHDHGDYASLRNHEVDLVFSQKDRCRFYVCYWLGVSINPAIFLHHLYLLRWIDRLAAIGVIRVIVFSYNSSSANPTCKCIISLNLEGKKKERKSQYSKANSLSRGHASPQPLVRNRMPSRHNLCLSTCNSSLHRTHLPWCIPVHNRPCFKLSIAAVPAQTNATSK